MMRATPPRALYPGKGYWVKANATGNINLGPTASPKPALQRFETLPTLTITDATGSRQKLHLAPGEVDLSAWEMPPVPPPGAFDARFESNRMAERFPGSDRSGVELRIRIQGSIPPVTVTFASGDGALSDRMDHHSYVLVE